MQCEEGEPLVYEAYLEVPPHISLPSYQGLEVSLEEEEVRPGDVEEELEKIQEKYASLVSVGDRPAQQNDYAVFDLRAEFLDGKNRHQSWQEENLSAVVGDDHTHRAFNEALGAMEAEGRKVFEVDYPPDYPDPELASHRVRYALHLKEIKQKQLPDLDDDLAKDVGEFESVDQLRDHVRQSLAEQHHVEATLAGIVHQPIERGAAVFGAAYAVIGVLVENLPAAIPDIAAQVEQLALGALI